MEFIPNLRLISNLNCAQIELDIVDIEIKQNKKKKK